MASEGVGAMWFLPSALNVKVMKFKQARVNGGSNYDSLKVAKCLVIYPCSFAELHFGVHLWAIWCLASPSERLIGKQRCLILVFLASHLYSVQFKVFIDSHCHYDRRLRSLTSRAPADQKKWLHRMSSRSCYVLRLCGKNIFDPTSQLKSEEAKTIVHFKTGWMRNEGWWKLSESGMGKVLGASCGLKFHDWKVDWWYWWGRRLVTPIILQYYIVSRPRRRPVSSVLYW